jgi:hypothetical protein
MTMTAKQLSIEVAVVDVDAVRAAVQEQVGVLIEAVWKFAAAGFVCGLLVGGLVVAWVLR